MKFVIGCFYIPQFNRWNICSFDGNDILHIFPYFFLPTSVRGPIKSKTWSLCLGRIWRKSTPMNLSTVNLTLSNIDFIYQVPHCKFKSESFEQQLFAFPHCSFLRGVSIESCKSYYIIFISIKNTWRFTELLLNCSIVEQGRQSGVRMGLKLYNIKDEFLYSCWNQSTI